MEEQENKNYFECPCLSYNKEFIQNNLDAINETLYLHTLPYIISDKKHFNEYKALVSYDICDVTLSGFDPEIQAKFMSSVLLNKKAIRTRNNEIQSDYKIFSSEYKYYQTHKNESMAYNTNYAIMDKEIENHFDLLIYTYFIVQNLIRLTPHKDTLYGVKQAKHLSHMISENDENEELSTYRKIKTSWDNHMNGALFVFGFVQNFLDKKGLSDIFKIQRYLTKSTMEQLKSNLDSKTFKENFISYINNKDNVFVSGIQDIFGYVLYAQYTIKGIKNTQSKNYYEGAILSPRIVKKFGFVKKEINFDPITQDEKNFIRDLK